jgi:hypothetical protein
VAEREATRAAALEPGLMQARVWQVLGDLLSGNPDRCATLSLGPYVVFREIVPPSRLVYEDGWDLPGAPLDFVVVVTLLPEGKRTRFSIHMTFRDAAAMKTAVELYGVLQGGTQTLDRLAHYLARAA